jgi:hypothetical protein
MSSTNPPSSPTVMSTDNTEMPFLTTPFSKRHSKYTDIRTGDVTIGEILNALEKATEPHATSFYPHIIDLHRSKCSSCTTNDLLNNLAKTQGQLEVLYKSNQVPCKWIYHLYNTMIALALRATVTKSPDHSKEASDLLKIITESWEQCLDSMPLS